MKTMLFVICVLVVSAGCAKKVSVHPGAISNLDSYAYDVLLVEQDTINAAKADFLAGNLPLAAKDPLNAAIAQYNITQSSWQVYHASGGDATALQQALNVLVGAVGELQRVLGKTPIPVKPVPGQPGPSSSLIREGGLA